MQSFIFVQIEGIEREKRTFLVQPWGAGSSKETTSSSLSMELAIPDSPCNHPQTQGNKKQSVHMTLGSSKREKWTIFPAEPLGHQKQTVSKKQSDRREEDEEQTWEEGIRVSAYLLWFPCVPQLAGVIFCWVATILQDIGMVGSKETRLKRISFHFPFFFLLQFVGSLADSSLLGDTCHVPTKKRRFGSGRYLYLLWQLGLVFPRSHVIMGLSLHCFISSR